MLSLVSYLAWLELAAAKIFRLSLEFLKIAVASIFCPIFGILAPGQSRVLISYAKKFFSPILRVLIS